MCSDKINKSLNFWKDKLVCDSGKWNLYILKKNMKIAKNGKN